MIYRYFLAFWILTSLAVAVQSTQYGLLGETVTFRTDFRDPPDDILWKHNGNKLVQFNGNEQTEYNPFQKRITLDWSSADLEINHLTHSDSGQYELDAGKKDRVTKPTVTCHMSDGSSSDKSGSEATLMCSTNTSQSLNYEWSQPGKVQPGQILTIPLGTEHDDKVYNCTVSNQLSREIATFTAKDCYPVGASAGLITGLVIGGIVILLCVLGAVFCTLKHKAYFAKEEKTDVEQQPHSKPLLQREETIPSSQPLRHLAEIVKNHNFDHNDEKHNELDLGTRESKESEEDKFVTAPEYPNANAHGASTNQPSLPLLNKTVVVGEDLNSDEVTGEKKEERRKKEENESDDMKKEPPTIPEKTEKNKDGPHVVTRNPSFLNDKGQLDKKVKSSQLEERTEATQPDLQTQITSKGPESEKMEDEEAKSADESSTQIIPHKPPAEEQKQDVISDQDTEKTIEETEKEKEEKKSDGMREKGELPTSSAQTDSEQETDEEAHPATKTSSSPDDVREEDGSPTTPTQTVKDKIKEIEKKQQAEKNKDGPHVVTRNPSFLNDKGQLDKKVKSSQLEERTEATHTA
ncbi:THO complex subunit 2-like isoform X2 [Oreochromis aureus]|uniref:THO complex subunit 2-like isoform X2 n=1 Tax=Oreochromis aureus TaxID=47969 RepID=UPI001953E965|nr:THO complex subunit 2-like isoform X2 [Oreochromis aureus]